MGLINYEKSAYSNSHRADFNHCCVQYDLPPFRYAYIRNSHYFRSMNIIIKAKRAVVKFGGVSGASVALGIPRSTLRDWIRKADVKQVKTPPEIPPVPAIKQQFVWCTNISHETAHLVDPATGKAACGISIGRFNRWTIDPDPLRKCLRCPANAH